MAFSIHIIQLAVNFFLNLLSEGTWTSSLVGMAFLTLLYVHYLNRTNQIVKEERQKADFEKKLLELEMSTLRSQMNPHFLFNCLNSIERSILVNDAQKASEYLNNFARLIRLILQNSHSNYILLSDEIEALDLYIQMEALRFKGKFKYEIAVDPQLCPHKIDIPPMLFQAFVENAIWHGLMNKNEKEERMVWIKLFKENGFLVGEIKDNGIGRARAKQIREEKATKIKKSTGIQIIHDRMLMINQLYNFNTSLDVIDLQNKDGTPAGTKVIIKIPI